MADDDNVSNESPKSEPQSFGKLIGQTEAVRRVTALVELARHKGEVFPHTLILGPDGLGKRTIAHAIARELGVNLRETSGSSIERGGDLAAIVNDLEKGDILLVLNVNRLRNYLVDILAPAIRTFELDVVVGKGPGARNMKLAVKPFTLIGTALKEADCPRDLLDSFEVLLPLQPYREPDMLQLTDRFAQQIGLSLDPGAAAAVARFSDGKPGRAESLVRRLRLVEKRPVSEQDAKEMLSVFGYGRTVAPSLEVADTDWTRLSGIEFERLITQLLNSMGFVAEMTKASGDGGVDIEAVFDRPIVGGRYLIQCKRFAPDAPVGSPIVREFYGALVADRKAVKGILITTSSFTPQAREFADNLPIELIDGEQLARLLSENASK